MHSPLKYRPDIDGLRAVAVLAVVVFHACPKWLPGGFSGVDIFFVLSGYLISGIIFNDLDRQQFSLAGFYFRRVRRIFPALCLVLAFCLAAGWSLMAPAEWRLLAKHELAGVGFVSNLLLARETGYFDAGAHTKPLLHLWSLGIEEQFYIFWPLTLAFLWKRTSLLLPAIFLIAGVSFVLNLALLARFPSDVFYQPATRMWELLAGAALARLTRTHGRLPSRFMAGLLAFLGALSIVAAFLLLNEKRAFPGWWALLPVAGTVLLVYAGPQAWLNRTILATRPAVFVGLISYPLYLWHWPLLVFLKLVNDSDWWFPWRTWILLRLAAVAVAFLLAWATWRFWEIPMRTSGSPALRVKWLAGMMAGVAIMAALSLGPFISRLSSPAALALAAAKSDMRLLEINHPGDAFAVYEVPSGSKHATLLAGDSHMEQYLPRIEAAIRADPRRATAVFASSNGCPPLPGLDRAAPGYRCPARYQAWTAQAMQPRFTTIVISAYWEYYTLGEYPGFEIPPQPPQELTVEGHIATARDLEKAWAGLETTLRSFVRAGKRVVIFSSSPSSFTFDSPVAFRRLHNSGALFLRPVSRHRLEGFLAPVTARLQRVARNSGAELVSPLDYLCHGDECPALGSDGQPMYRDNNHLRASKVVDLAAFVDDVLRP